MTRLTRVFLAVAALSLAACSHADVVTGPTAHRRANTPVALSGTYALAGTFDGYADRFTGRVTFSGNTAALVIEGMGAPIRQTVTVKTVPAGTVSFSFDGGAGIDWRFTGQVTSNGKISGRHAMTDGVTVYLSGPWTAAK